MPNGTGLATGSAIPAGNLEAQAFSPTKLQEYGSDAIFYSIAAQREYSMYCFEVYSYPPIGAVRPTMSNRSYIGVALGSVSGRKEDRKCTTGTTDSAASAS